MIEGASPLNFGPAFLAGPRPRDQGAIRRDLDGHYAGLLGLLSLLVFGSRNLLRRGFPKHLGKGLQHSGLPNGVVVDRVRFPRRFAFPSPS